MSELIDNAKARQAVLKHLILQLHEGKAPQEVKPQLLRLLGRVPYHEVVAVEQELIKDGVPVEDILRLCDLHSAAMKGALDSSGPPELPPGHPVDTFRKENQALIGELELADRLFAEIEALPEEADAEEPLGHLRVRFSRLADVGKHYSRKENLVFPYLEQKGITGPPTVMWGKDDEVRAAVKGALEALAYSGRVSVGDAKGVIDLVLRPAVEAIREMIFKEEEILFPMCLEKLTDAEWYAIARQSPAIGFCIYDPVEDWQPEGPAAETETASPAAPDRLQFPSGSLSPVEIQTILNTIPFDLTFVGADDTVRYFTQGRERIFERNRAIIGRKVQHCHPPRSVHI
ncbi:MAG TPA: DUF438 domain-containing protein, partial [candidate division Zixibacteria bacterium]|nr:DUF438 domain-containing protein [candidate division Zixibacteria bacterium]